MGYHSSLKRYVYATCIFSLSLGRVYLRVEHTCRERLRAHYVEHICRECLRAHYVEHICRECLRAQYVEHICRECLGAHYVEHICRECLRAHYVEHICSADKLVSVVVIAIWLRVMTQVVFGAAGVARTISLLFRACPHIRAVGLCIRIGYVAAFICWGINFWGALVCVS